MSLLLLSPWSAPGRRADAEAPALRRSPPAEYQGQQPIYVQAPRPQNSGGGDAAAIGGGLLAGGLLATLCCWPCFCCC